VKYKINQVVHQVYHQVMNKFWIFVRIRVDNQIRNPAIDQVKIQLKMEIDDGAVP